MPHILFFNIEHLNILISCDHCKRNAITFCYKRKIQEFLEKSEGLIGLYMAEM